MTTCTRIAATISLFSSSSLILYKTHIYVGQLGHIYVFIRLYTWFYLRLAMTMSILTQYSREALGDLYLPYLFVCTQLVATRSRYRFVIICSSCALILIVIRLSSENLSYCVHEYLVDNLGLGNSAAAKNNWQSGASQKKVGSSSCGNGPDCHLLHVSNDDWSVRSMLGTWRSHVEKLGFDRTVCVN